MPVTTITDTPPRPPRPTSLFMDRNPCPPKGEGVNAWIYKACLSLRGCGWTNDEEIAALLQQHAPQATASEVERAIVRSAQQAADTPTPSTFKARPAAPQAAYNREQTEAAIVGYGGLDQLKASSPADVSKWTSEAIVDGLFGGNPWICVGRNQYTGRTERRDDLRGIENQFQFIVPNPMRAKTGITQEGKVSQHCLDGTGPRHFLIIESDKKDMTRDQKASVLLHLGESAPLAMVVHSGSESLHGWFYCKGQEEDRLMGFFDRALALGGDKATKTRCQFVRMPGATRDNGNPQSVLFFNPAAVPGCPSIPPPEGYCSGCWAENTAYKAESVFPCNHQKGGSK